MKVGFVLQLYFIVQVVLAILKGCINMNKIVVCFCVLLSLFTVAAFASGEVVVVSPSNMLHLDIASPAVGKDAPLVGFKQSGVGAVVRMANDKAREIVTPEDFGAVGSGLVDDTAALQAAIDAWAINRSVEITLTGRYLILGTLRVGNLETDNPETRLSFTGGGTLIKNNPGFMFDRPASLQALQTGHIFFKGIRFEGAGLVGQTFIINGDNVIRVHFIGCFGTKINIAKAVKYLQTIYLDNTTWRKWRGYLLDAGRLFDVSLMGSVFEAGDGVLITRMASADPAVNSLKIMGGIIEGMSGLSGAAVSVGVVYGAIISGMYFEGNNGGDLNFSAGTGYHKGLVIEANAFQPTVAQKATGAYFPVVTGKGAADALVLMGNASTQNLFDVTVGNQSAVLDAGNYVAAGGLKFSATSTRIFSFGGTKLSASMLPGYGVELDSNHSAIGFEPTRSTVNKVSVVAEIVYGSVSPQEAPGAYTNTQWKKGSIVFNSAPTIALRRYGSEGMHNALIIGWMCMTNGAPGTWQEISTMLPY